MFLSAASRILSSAVLQGVVSVHVQIGVAVSALLRAAAAHLGCTWEHTRVRYREEGEQNDSNPPEAT